MWALALLALAGAAAASDDPLRELGLSPLGASDPEMCDPDYDCKQSFTDIYGTLYEFDFSTLCSKFGYRTNDTSGHVFDFNICGRAFQHCAPKGYKARYMFGAAVQFYGGKPACNQAAPECFDPYRNISICCTENCEVLGVGTPIWKVRDLSNVHTGGINLTFMGNVPEPNDPAPCPYNAKTGTMDERDVTFVMQCNPSLAKNSLEVLRVHEDSPCHYVIEIATGAACACAPDCKHKTCGTDGCGGFCSGASMLGKCPGDSLDPRFPSRFCRAGTCCYPDCRNRDCGNDGCGGSCGTCGSDELCSTQQVCILNPAELPPRSGEVVYFADGGSMAGAYFGGILVAAALAGAFFCFTPTGRLTYARVRQRGLQGLLSAEGDAGAEALVAGEGRAAASSRKVGGSYGSAGGYGSTSVGASGERTTDL